MAFDQGYADALQELDEVKHQNVVLAEEVAELQHETARLHVLLAEHGIADPARAKLSARQRRVLAEADVRTLTTHNEEH